MEHSPPVRCLNLHADYLCHHSGACCTAGWTIPIERPAYEKVTLHFGRRFAVEPSDLPPGAAAIVATRPDGTCVFFDADDGRLCAIHRELGVAALPTACRQFPRVVLHDARGTMIGLSHFCPSAAALLRDPAPPSIVDAPSNVALEGPLEGFDAREALPPLLHREMLTDAEGYAAWERGAIRVLARNDLTYDQAVEAIAAATLTAQAWRPGGASLSDAVQRAFDRCSIPDAIEDLDADERRVSLALESVPEGLARSASFAGFRAAWPEASTIVCDFDRSVRAYLAARLFGNWVAYHVRGLHAVVEYLRICLSVLKMEAARHSACSSVSTPWQTVIEPAIRNADLLLVHLSDMKSLARRLP